MDNFKRLTSWSAACKDIPRRLITSTDSLSRSSGLHIEAYKRIEAIFSFNPYALHDLSPMVIDCSLLDISAKAREY